MNFADPRMTYLLGALIAFIIVVLFLMLLHNLAQQSCLARLVEYVIYALMGAGLAYVVVILISRPDGLAALIKGVQSLSNPPKLILPTQQPSSGFLPTPTPAGNVNNGSPAAPEVPVVPTKAPVQLSGKTYDSGVPTSNNYPDGWQCSPGTQFEKDVRVANTGSEAWNGVKAKLVIGDGADQEINIPDTPSGGFANFSFKGTCGDFNSSGKKGANSRLLRYTFQTSDGTLFGRGITFTYEVVK